MNTFIYDRTFSGLLSVIFKSYQIKTFPDVIVSQEEHQPAMLENVYRVTTLEEHSRRVLKGIEKKTTPRITQDIYKVFLSELPGIEMTIFRYIRLILDAGTSMLDNYTIPCVLEMKQVLKRMDKEVHRMHAYVRFHKGADDVFYSFVSPDFDVLPLLADHFEKRFADQPWMIFDTKRKYGLYYDLKQVCEVKLEEAYGSYASGNLPGEFLDVKEYLYQQLWKAYFQSVNIPERKNLKLQLRSMPRRYWRFLPEMRTVSYA